MQNSRAAPPAAVHYPKKWITHCEGYYLNETNVYFNHYNIKTAFTRFINSKEKRLHNSNLFFSHSLYPEQGQISHAEARISFLLANPLKVTQEEREAAQLSIFLHILLLKCHGWIKRSPMAYNPVSFIIWKELWQRKKFTRPLLNTLSARGIAQ